MADHLDNIIINISLDPPPLGVAGFGTEMIIADGSTTSLDGDRIRTYAELPEVQTDYTAGFVSAAMLAAATAVFSQRTPPAELKIGRKAPAESYAAALPLIEAVDDDFYGITIESRTAADQVAVGAVVEASNRIFIFQSSDADWLTASIPAAYSAMAGYERSAVLFHDTNAQPGDFAWAANRLVWDPDIISAPWDCAVQGVSGLATTLTTTQKGNLEDNNGNVGLPYGSETFFVDPGVSLAGRPLHEILTADWFKARLREAIVLLKTGASARGEKVVIGASGQAQVLAEIASLFQRGTAGTSPHFIEGQTEQTAYEITQADYDAARMRFAGRAQQASSARKFVFGFNFTRSPIFDE